MGFKKNVEKNFKICRKNFKILLTIFFLYCRLQVGIGKHIKNEEMKMKKLITILAVMMVLVGFAFAATETHNLNVEITIDPVYPIFSLYYEEHSNDNTTGDETTNAFAVKPSYTITNQKTTAGADITADNAITVSAYVMNKAKVKQNYTLTFSGGDFDSSVTGCTSLNINGTATVKNASIATAPTTTAIVGISEISETAEGTLVAKFNGTQMTATDKSVVLGTATYTYTVDWNTVDPGTYTTNIVLTITT